MMQPRRRGSGRSSGSYGNTALEPLVMAQAVVSMANLLPRRIHGLVVRTSRAGTAATRGAGQGRASKYTEPMARLTVPAVLCDLDIDHVNARTPRTVGITGRP